MTLWLLILLGVIGLAYTSSVRIQLQASRHDRGRREAYWAARAGIEKALAWLGQTDLAHVSTASDTMDNEAAFRDQWLSHSAFSLIGAKPSVDEEPKFGLIDESAYLNVNTIDEKWMMLLPAMTDEMSQSVVDWRDSNKTPRPLGGEDEYYMSLDDPYMPRNGPLQSVLELVRVKGWGPVYDSAMPDPYSKFTSAADKPATAASTAAADDARKLLGMLTAVSKADTKAPDGRKKLKLTTADDKALRQRIQKLTDTEARAIALKNTKAAFKDPTELLDVEPPPPTASPTPKPGATPARMTPTPTPSATTASKKMFTLARVGEIIDYVTVADDANDEKAGLINVNTAPYDVLLSIPGMDETLAQAIIQERGSRGFIASRGAVAGISGMTDAAFRKIYPLICARSKTFRAVSRGYEPDSGAAATIEAVFTEGTNGFEITSWREK